MWIVLNMVLVMAVTHIVRGYLLVAWTMLASIKLRLGLSFLIRRKFHTTKARNVERSLDTSPAILSYT